MTFFETFILTIFDALMILLVTHSINRDFTTTILNKILFIVITSIVIALTSIYVINEQLSHLLCVIFEIFIFNGYLYFNGEKRIIKNTLLFFTIMIMLTVVQLLSVILILLVKGSIDYTIYTGLISQMISVILFIILSKFAPLQKINGFIKDNNILFSFTITTSFLLYYGITILWYSDVDHITATPLGIITLVVLAVAINTIILREGFTNQMYKDKLKVLETYNPIVEDMIDELRTKQHDYHNHIQTLISIKSSDIITEEETMKYAQDICEDDILNILRRLDNRIVGAFLHSKIIEASKNNIKVVLNIENIMPDSLFDTHEIIEMFGILIDNAFDAVKGEKAASQNVFMTIKKEDAKSIFEVRNRYRYVSVKEIQKFFQRGHSTKKENGHGIGLYKLKTILAKKEGAIQFSYDTESEEVVARIYLSIA